MKSEIFYPLHYEFALTRLLVRLVHEKYGEPTTEQKEKLSLILDKFDYQNAAKKGVYPGFAAKKIIQKF